MLVLSRRTDEKIVLPTVPAVIKVVAAHNGLTRLGIEAPSTVPILREELYRDDHRNREVRRPAPEAAPEGHLGDVLRHRLNNVILELSLLRMRLQHDSKEEVRQNLDGIEQEIQALRRAVEASLPELETVTVSPTVP